MKGYKLSTDYDKLWDLIQTGIRVPAWILYSKEFKEPIYDIVEVKMSKIFKVPTYNIGSRGISYNELDESKDGFKSACEIWELKYVIPNDITEDKENEAKELLKQLSDKFNDGGLEIEEQSMFRLLSWLLEDSDKPVL